MGNGMRWALPPPARASRALPPPAGSWQGEGASIWGRQQPPPCAQPRAHPLSAMTLYSSHAAVLGLATHSSTKTLKGSRGSVLTDASMLISSPRE